MSSLLKAIEKAQEKSPAQNLDLSDYASESLTDTKVSSVRSPWILAGIGIVSVSVIAVVAVLIKGSISGGTLHSKAEPEQVGVHQSMDDSERLSETTPVSSQKITESVTDRAVGGQETAALYAEARQSNNTENELNSAVETPVVGESLWQDATPIAELPLDLMLELDAINYSAHVFNPDSGEGFAFINGERLESGSFLGIAQVQALVEQGVILKARGTLFRIDALQDWELQLSQ